MSNLSDTLKKKVCVTVFLDELFEEVAEEEEERKDIKQVSEIPETVVKIPEEPVKEPSRVHLSNDEKVNVTSNADMVDQLQSRPRKHRRESKFSKNRYDTFKSELTKYGYRSRSNENRDPADSAVSDSDFDLNEFLSKDKWALEKSKSSFTDFSEGDLTDHSFISVNTAPSSTMISCTVQVDQTEKPKEYFESCVVYCNKSTQFEAPEEENKVGGKVSAEKETQKEDEDVLAWKKTHTPLQFILEDAKSRDGEISEGDRIMHYDLESILEECIKKEGMLSDKSILALSNESMDCNESKPTNSFPCLSPQDKQSLPAPEVKRVWTSTNNGLDSDLSESDCTKDVTIIPVRNDSLLCYSLCLNCEDSELSEFSEKDGQIILRTSVPPCISKSSSGNSSLDSAKSKSSREAGVFLQTVAQLGDRSILSPVWKTENDKKKGSDISQELWRSRSAIEGMNKNFAEGDTIAKPFSCDSTFILDFDTKEKLLVCDEILKHVGEPKVLCNEIIVNRAEIALLSQSELQQGAETLFPVPKATANCEAIAEVFFNQKSESLEKTDAESEMVFAESENFCDSDDFLCSKYSVGPATSIPKSFQKDICVLEFEEKLSRSKILRRMKTVEILGDSSLNDMKNISTEVILICENLSSNEVCMEAWQSSASTLKSLSELGQCYLKDSQDNAMYLIEIPLHFTKAKKSEHFFKPPDSD